MSRKYQPIAIPIVLIGMLSIVVIAQNTGATVLLPVSVMDGRNTPVAGLKQENFQLLEESKEQKIAFVYMRSTFFRLSGTPSTVQDERDNSSSWLTVFEDAARNTGGRLIYAEPLTTLNEECVKLAEELKNQYVLGFTSADDVPRGKWRNLKVNVNTPTGQPKLTLRYKPRYFVPKPGKND